MGHLLSAHEEIAKLKAVISTQHFPNTKAIATKLPSNVSAHEQQLINYANECIEPAIMLVTDFKYARYFDPTKIMELKPCSTDIDNVKAFPFLIDRNRRQRTSELPG